MKPDIEHLPELVATLEQQVKVAREVGSPAAIIAAARLANDEIRKRIHTDPQHVSDDERTALIALKRLLFNAAADCWPGWAIDSPPVTKSELEAALELAQSSADVVEMLALGSLQEGTAQWLIGAFHLALLRLDDAHAHFMEAERCYREVPAPGLALLVQGYVAIAYEIERRPPPDGVLSFNVVIERIAAGPFEDRDFWRDQLQTAQHVFVAGTS